MKVEVSDLAERQWLQNRINSILNSLSSRDIQLIGQVHSESVATVMISVAGRYGTMQSCIVLSKTKDLIENNIMANPNDPLTYYWVGYANGYKYRFSGITELGALIKRQVGYMKSNMR